MEKQLVCRECSAEFVGRYNRRFCDVCGPRRKEAARKRGQQKLLDDGYYRRKYRDNIEAYRQRSKTWNDQNRDHINQWSREYRKERPEQARAAWQRWAERHPNHRREYYLRTTYGITLEQYNEWAAAGCSICGETEKRLVVDHRHSDGFVRGLLCDRCNTAIAHEDPKWLIAAVEYLRRADGV